MKHFPFILLAAFGLFSSCAVKKNLNTDSITQLQEMMTGSYNSAEQAAQDSSYYNISLHMYPIWKDKGHYLYVEQALFEAQDRPYRQRIYQLIKQKYGVYESKVYKLKEEKDYIGKWQSPEYFNSKDLSILEEREGCSVYLIKNGNRFEGSTKDDNCKSSLRGARYATSIVTVFEGQIESWDQGFDSEGKQVWGATKGAYLFKK